MGVTMKGITKSYGKVQALSGVDFECEHGEVMAIVGDNGAGKSTLIKILAGALQPDDGIIEVDGKECSFDDPMAARTAGIETLYQDLAVLDGLDVTLNFFLGRERVNKFGFLRFTSMQMEAKSLMDQYSVREMNIRSALKDLSGGQRQIVALARTTGFGSRYVILDEPTSALSPAAAAEVLEVVASLRTKDIGVVLITHNILHAFHVADRITVLRLGETAGVREVSETSEEEIVGMMVGSAAFAKIREDVGAQEVH